MLFRSAGLKSFGKISFNRRQPQNGPGFGYPVSYTHLYIAHLSMQKIRDESGNTYWGIDEDLRERLQAKLMRAVLNFKAD